MDAGFILLHVAWLGWMLTAVALLAREKEPRAAALVAAPVALPPLESLGVTLPEYVVAGLVFHALAAPIVNADRAFRWTAPAVSVAGVLSIALWGDALRWSYVIVLAFAFTAAAFAIASATRHMGSRGRSHETERRQIKPAAFVTASVAGSVGWSGRTDEADWRRVEIVAARPAEGETPPRVYAAYVDLPKPSGNSRGGALLSAVATQVKDAIDAGMWDTGAAQQVAIEIGDRTYTAQVFSAMGDSVHSAVSGSVGFLLKNLGVNPSVTSAAEWVAGGFTLPFDRLLRKVKRVLQFAGMFLGAVTGQHWLSAPCVKWYAHDKFGDFVRMAIVEVLTPGDDRVRELERRRDGVVVTRETQRAARADRRTEPRARTGREDRAVRPRDSRSGRDTPGDTSRPRPGGGRARDSRRPGSGDDQARDSRGPGSRDDTGAGRSAHAGSGRSRHDDASPSGGPSDRFDPSDHAGEHRGPPGDRSSSDSAGREEPEPATSGDRPSDGRPAPADSQYDPARPPSSHSMPYLYFPGDPDLGRGGPPEIEGPGR
jgi:hypothetical protein